MRSILWAAITTIVLTTTTSAYAADFDVGEFLQDNCIRCHDDSVYKRPDRLVNSMTQLDSRVRMCDANFGTKLFDDDIASLVDYLNTHYYHFEK